jgi:hypothetical protein
MELSGMSFEGASVEILRAGKKRRHLRMTDKLFVLKNEKTSEFERNSG